MVNNGRDYERFVAALQQALFESETWADLRNIKIEQNKILEDNLGIKREFDLYWEYELGGISYKTVIECKDYTSKITIEKIDALIGKIHDLPDLKPIFATKTGYQSGARRKAKANNVELLIVRKENDSDWKLDDGTPLIKEVKINMHAIAPAQIISFSPHLDGKWAKENTNIDLTNDQFKLEMRNDLTFIDDIDNSDKYSLLQLAERLGHKENSELEEKTINLTFKEAYLYCGDIKLKMGAADITYIIPKPLEADIHIDFSKELVGVIEYLNKNSKTAIFKHRVVKNWNNKR